MVSMYVAGVGGGLEPNKTTARQYTVLYVLLLHVFTIDFCPEVITVQSLMSLSLYCMEIYSKTSQ